MKHEINELYNIFNMDNIHKLATREYCEANGIAIPVTTEERKYIRKNALPYASECHGHQNPYKPLKVLDKDGYKVIHMFGNHTYFDTAEERDIYSKAWHEQEAKERAFNKLKKELLAKVEKMSAEELKKLIEKI